MDYNLSKCLSKKLYYENGTAYILGYDHENQPIKYKLGDGLVPAGKKLVDLCICSIATAFTTAIAAIMVHSWWTVTPVANAGWFATVTGGAFSGIANVWYFVCTFIKVGTALSFLTGIALIVCVGMLGSLIIYFSHRIILEVVHGELRH